MTTVRIIFYCVCAIASQFVLPAATAERYVLPMSGGEEIDLQKDHYTVGLIKSRISEKDAFFKSLISEKTKLAVSLTATLRFFDGAESSVTVVQQDTDLFRTTSRSWGVTASLFDQVPADSGAALDIKVMLYRQDRLGDVVGAITGVQSSLSKTAVPNPFDGTWLGYSKLAAGILDSLFDAGKQSFPFFWKGDIKSVDTTKNGSMKEHYIVLIAPRSDSDKDFNQITAAGLTFEDQDLFYNGHKLTEFSYAVLAVRRAPNPDIVRLIYESSEPWAKLAQDQFTFRATSGIKSKEQLAALSENFFSELRTEEQLLKAEHRFSKTDRATALATFAARASKLVSTRCRSLKLSEADCPTADLDNYVETASETFGLTPAMKPVVLSSAERVSTGINERIFSALKQFNEQQTYLGHQHVNGGFTDWAESSDALAFEHYYRSFKQPKF